MVLVSQRIRVFQRPPTRPSTQPQLEPQLNPNLTRVGVRVGVQCLNAIYFRAIWTSTHTSTLPLICYYKQQHVNNMQHQLEYQPWHPPLTSTRSRQRSTTLTLSQAPQQQWQQQNSTISAATTQIQQRNGSNKGLSFWLVFSLFFYILLNNFYI